MNDAAPSHNAPLPLSVAITSFNSMRTIEITLDSLAGVASQIVVVDSGSTDGTIEACQSRGAEVIHQDWLGHVKQKQFAIDRCDQPFVLLLDSDESLEPDLAAAIRTAIETDDPAIVGWSINRKIWFLGGWLHHVFQPEYRLRMFRRGRGRVAGVPPHDRIDVDGRTARLAGICRHDSWVDLNDMVQRSTRYAELIARNGAGGGRLHDILLRPWLAVFKQLVFKSGWRDGGRGVVAMAGVAVSVLLKHMYIAAAREKMLAGDD